MDHQEKSDRVSKALDSFRIEIPSWGFANTGTRFGKFLQMAAANSIEEKFADAAEIHQLTGVTPTLGLHVEWDLPEGVDECAADSSAGKEIPDLRWLHQPQSFPGAGIQVRVDLQPGSRSAAEGSYAPSGLCGDCPATGIAGYFPVGFRWFELSGNAEYAAAHWLDGRDLQPGACGACSRISGC